jgi:pyruvate, orthophosphate dikinase
VPCWLQDIDFTVQEGKQVMLHACWLQDIDFTVQEGKQVMLHVCWLQDIEFTVQEGKLFMLQCRSGKRTGPAAVKIAVELVAEGVLDTDSAIMLVEPTHLDQLLHPQFLDEEAYKPSVIGTGLPASPGAAVGQVGICTRAS